MAEYWNHNTAYHPWLASIAREHGGDVLDVGCGDGLLAQRLAPVSRSITAIEPDPVTAARARDRLAGHGSVSVHETTLAEYESAEACFDLITFVATIHHMDLRASLLKARDLLRPSGEIAIVGLAANTTPWDWICSALCLPAVRIGSSLHHETRDIGVPVADARENLGEIRRVAHEVIPGAHVRRALYYRYLLRWTRSVG